MYISVFGKKELYKFKGTVIFILSNAYNLLCALGVYMSIENITRSERMIAIHFEKLFGRFNYDVYRYRGTGGIEPCVL